jgi:hypothetical protein
MKNLQVWKQESVIPPPNTPGGRCPCNLPRETFVAVQPQVRYYEIELLIQVYEFINFI